MNKRTMRMTPNMKYVVTRSGFNLLPPQTDFDCVLRGANFPSRLGRTLRDPPSPKSCGRLQNLREGEVRLSSSGNLLVRSSVKGQIFICGTKGNKVHDRGFKPVLYLYL